MIVMGCADVAPTGPKQRILTPMDGEALAMLGTDAGIDPSTALYFAGGLVEVTTSGASERYAFIAASQGTSAAKGRIKWNATATDGSTLAIDADVDCLA